MQDSPGWTKFHSILDHADRSFEKLARNPHALAMLGTSLNTWARTHELKSRTPHSPSNAVKLLETLQRLRLKPAKRLPLFEATPSRVIHQDGSLKVKHYASWQRPARGTVVIFPSLINRPYVLDLGRGRSLIRHLVQVGFEVMLLDWGRPTNRERDLGLSQLLNDRVPRALHSIRGYSQSPETQPFSLIGHCLGGNLALKFVEQHPSHFDRLILLTTPIDTKNDALLTRWAQIPEWDPKLFARAFEFIPWSTLQASFLLQRPSLTPRRWAQLFSRMGDRDFRESWLQMEIWSNDGVSFPSQLFQDLLIPLYRENSMNRESRLEIPIFSLIAKDDHIVPMGSALAIERTHTRCRHEIHIARGGHVGAVIAARTRREIWPKMTDFLSSRLTPTRG